MISLHHLGHPPKPFHLNRDLILAVEANPDTVITLTNGDKLLVAEDPETVVGLVRESRIDVLAQALQRRPADPVARVRPDARPHPDAPLSVVPAQRPRTPPPASA